MIITNDEYNNWIKMARYVITNSKHYSTNINQDVTDLTHNLFERFVKYQIDQDDINDSYIYMSLKNLWNDTIREKIKSTNIIVSVDLDDVLLYTQEQDTYDLDADRKTQREINHLHQCVKNMKEEYQQIYFLYFIKGLTQAEIANYIHRSKSFIQNRVAYIKDIIEKSK